MGDVTIVPISDWHTGSTTALHPNVRKDAHGIYRTLGELGGWKYSDNQYFYPSSTQIRIWKHFDKCLDEIAKQRKDTKMLLLLAGDAIDGSHHNTPQLVTRHISEQVETHIELVEYAMQKLGYTQGDMLACLFGTDCHVGNEEEIIAKRLNAYQYPSGNYCANFLDITISGVRIWAYHKGVSAGQGFTRGNACIAAMKKIYYQCLQDGDEVPQLIITGHTHDAYHATWTAPNGMIMNYVILSSWQDKTRFVNDNMATNKNKVGMQTITIKENGAIIINKPMLLSSPLGERITI